MTNRNDNQVPVKMHLHNVSVGDDDGNNQEICRRGRQTNRPHDSNRESKDVANVDVAAQDNKNGRNRKNSDNTIVPSPVKKRRHEDSTTASDAVRVDENDEQHHQPSCVVSDQCVIFGWDNLPGNVAFRAVVQTFSNNSLQYPEWNDSICDLVRTQLMEKNNRTRFRLLKDRNGALCSSFRDCLVVSATNEEILLHTKKQFLENRSRSNE